MSELTPENAAGVGDNTPTLAELLKATPGATEPQTREVFVPDLGPTGTMVKVRQLSAKEVLEIATRKNVVIDGKHVPDAKHEAYWYTVLMLHYAVVYPKFSIADAEGIMAIPGMAGVVDRILAAINAANAHAISDDIEKKVSG